MQRENLVVRTVQGGRKLAENGRDPAQSLQDSGKLTPVAEKVYIYNRPLNHKLIELCFKNQNQVIIMLCYVYVWMFMLCDVSSAMDYVKLCFNHNIIIT